MTTTLPAQLLGIALAALLALGFAPLALAEEDTDWEEKAAEKIELVEELVADAEELMEELDEDEDDFDEDLDEALEYLAAAEAAFDDEEFEEAYEEAAEAYEEVSELINELKEEQYEDDEEKENDDDEKDEDDYGDDDKYEDKDDDEYVSKQKADRKERAAEQRKKCRMDMLRDGERDRKFCRDGEWKEKREARLSDITDGFIEADELDGEEVEAIRQEIEDLIRQLVMLIMMARLGS
jgi:hypothetical protein